MTCALSLYVQKAALERAAWHTVDLYSAHSHVVCQTLPQTVSVLRWTHLSTCTLMAKSCLLRLHAAETRDSIMVSDVRRGGGENSAPYNGRVWFSNEKHTKRLSCKLISWGTRWIINTLRRKVSVSVKKTLRLYLHLQYLSYEPIKKDFVRLNSSDVCVAVVAVIPPDQEREWLATHNQYLNICFVRKNKLMTAVNGARRTRMQVNSWLTIQSSFVDWINPD